MTTFVTSPSAVTAPVIPSVFIKYEPSITRCVARVSVAGKPVTEFISARSVVRSTSTDNPVIGSLGNPVTVTALLLYSNLVNGSVILPTVVYPYPTNGLALKLFIVVSVPKSMNFGTNVLTVSAVI